MLGVFATLGLTFLSIRECSGSGFPDAQFHACQQVKEFQVRTYLMGIGGTVVPVGFWRWRSMHGFLPGALVAFVLAATLMMLAIAVAKLTG